MTAKMKKIPVKSTVTGRPSPKKEKRKLVAHDALLMSVIRDQAGTLEKALLEAVMNSIDAKASLCDIMISSKLIRIIDDGQGITTRRAIEQYFEKFGTPHEAGEDKRYGRFRMGRGQLFSFGANYWRTGEFRMRVDIARDGQSYDLESGHKKVDGCTIEISLYDELDTHDIARLTSEVGRQCRFAEIDLKVNGKTVNMRASDHTWTKETPDAYIEENDTATVYIYNQGAFVCAKGFIAHGFSGVIVSKKPLKVNFARNEVMSTCPVWKRIIGSLRTEAESRNKEMQNRRLEDKEVEWITGLLCDISDSHSVETKGWQTMGMIDLADGRRLSVNSLMTKLLDCRREDNDAPLLPVVFADKGDRRADMAMQLGRCIAVARKQPGRLQGGAHLFSTLSRLVDATFKDQRLMRSLESVKVATIEEVMAGVVGVFEDRDYQECLPSQQLWLDLAQNMSYEFHKYCRFQEHQNPAIARIKRWTYRRIYAGHSDCALAWTDGRHKIFLDIGYLESLKLGLIAIIDLANLIVHEMMHDDHDMQTHSHSQEFYQDFHDIASGVIGPMTRTAMLYLRRKKVRDALPIKDRRRLQQDSPFDWRNLKEVTPAKK